jgi:hypothetical protein
MVERGESPREACIRVVEGEVLTEELQRKLQVDGIEISAS